MGKFLQTQRPLRWSHSHMRQVKNSQCLPTLHQLLRDAQNSPTAKQLWSPRVMEEMGQLFRELEIQNQAQNLSPTRPMQTFQSFTKEIQETGNEAPLWVWSSKGPAQSQSWLKRWEVRESKIYSHTTWKSFPVLSRGTEGPSLYSSLRPRSQQSFLALVWKELMRMRMTMAMIPSIHSIDCLAPPTCKHCAKRFTQCFMQPS